MTYQDFEAFMSQFRSTEVAIICREDSQFYELAEMECSKRADRAPIRWINNILKRIQDGDVPGPAPYCLSYEVDDAGEPKWDCWCDVGYYKGLGYPVVEFEDILCTNQDQIPVLPDASAILDGI